MKQIIIDNDGGTDDFLTIQYAVLSKQFDIKAITLVAGNTGVENVKNNVFKALEMSGVTPEEAEKIGVYIPKYVNHDTVSDGAQGSNGLGGVEYQINGDYKLNDGNAEDILVQTVAQNPGNVSILAIGPLTNIANAIKQDPKFVKNVDELIIMGGDEGGGNITPYAEFNIYQDPEAAKVVFEAGFDKLTMLGFNITKKFTLAMEYQKFLRSNTDGFIFDITRDTDLLDFSKNEADGAAINDVLTAMYLIHKEQFFKTKKAKVQVDVSQNITRGRTNIIETDNANDCNIVTEINQTRLMGELLSTLYPQEVEKLRMTMKYQKIESEISKKLLEQFPILKSGTKDLIYRNPGFREAVMKPVMGDLINKVELEKCSKLMAEYFYIILSKGKYSKRTLIKELSKKYPEEKSVIKDWINEQGEFAKNSTLFFSLYISETTKFFSLYGDRVDYYKYNSMFNDR